MNQAASKGLWTKSFTGLVLLNGQVSLVHSMLIATVPLFILQLGGDAWTAGLSMGVYTFTALAFRPWFGHLLDTRGRRRVFLVGSLLLLLGTLLMPLALWVGVVPILVLRAVQGAGFSALSNAMGTLVADLIPHHRLTEGIGLFGLSFIVAGALGPALGLTLGAWWSYPAVFLLMAGLLALVFGVTAASNLGQGWVPIPKKMGGVLSFLEPAALVPAAVVLLTAFPWGATMTFLPVYGTKLGLALGAVFFLVYSGAVLVTRLTTGKIADKHGAFWLIIGALVLAGTAMTLLALVHTLEWFLVAAVVYGLGAGILQPLLMAQILKACPSHRRGVANAMFYSAMDLGVGLGAVGGGVVAQFWGLPSVFWAGTAAVAVALAVYLTTSRRT